VTQVLVNGKPLDPQRTYRLATINYLYEHPQYERSLGRGTNVMFGLLCLEVVSDYIVAHSPVSPRVEGRIRRQ